MLFGILLIIGAAAALKMLRSVVIKGMEGLWVEALLAARERGVVEPLLAMIEETLDRYSARDFATMLVTTHVGHAGRRQVEEIRAAYAAAGFDAEVEAFFADMERRFEAADLLIARAGATTVAEVQAAGRAAIFIPLPYAADDHQRKNARAMVEQGASAMIDPDDLNGSRLAGEIRRLMGDPVLLERMEANARKGAILDAESRIADLIERAAGARLSPSDGVERAHSAM